MAVVITNPTQTEINRVAISEQNKILKYIISKIEESGLFENYEVNFNDLKTSSSNVGVILNSGSRKNRTFVDGGYDAIIPITVILRNVGNTTDNKTLHGIDLINQLGIYFEENITRDKSIEGYTISDVVQQTQATVTYRDESGIEDCGADFNINYSKD
jgi:hypothetical protein